MVSRSQLSGPLGRVRTEMARRTASLTWGARQRAVETPWQQMLPYFRDCNNGSRISGSIAAELEQDSG